MIGLSILTVGTSGMELVLSCSVVVKLGMQIENRAKQALMRLCLSDLGLH